MKNILLVQFRTDVSASHEKNCFLRYFRKRQDLKLKIVNAFENRVDFSSPQKIIRDSCGVMLGGSGEFYFSGNREEKEKVFRKMLKRIAPFIKYLLRNDFPTLGICFGHQLLGYFLGGKVVRDENQAETGSFLVYLTQEGKKAPLFSKIPEHFFAQFGHRDSLESLPEGTKLLARTKKCQVAAFQYKTNIWGIQFHPELNYKDMIFRLKLYPEYTQKELKAIRKILKPSPFSSKVIPNFLKIWLCRKP